ncbi:MAG TPA: sigma factor [Tepidisphaeraceae bacterium]|nr:sigma factor [Tepidisphaeraceae bacterium]
MNTSINRQLTALDPLIVRLVRRRVRGRLEQHRDDVEQACRVKLWRALPKYEARDGASAETFATTVVTNAISDELEKLQARPTDAALPDDLAADDDAGGADELLTAAIENPDEHLTPAEAHLLRLVEQYPDRSELAAHLNIPVARVWERVCRLKKSLLRKVA